MHIFLFDLKIFDEYCRRKGLQEDAVRFAYDGERINRNETPKTVFIEYYSIIFIYVQLELKDNDVVRIISFTV